MPQADLKVNKSVLFGLVQARAALQQEELELKRHVLDFHQPLFRTFREDLRREFLSHSVALDEEGGERKKPVWNPIAGDPFLAELQVNLDEVYGVAYEEDEGLFAEELDAAMVEGQQRQLWLMTLAGLPGQRYLDDDALPDEGSRRMQLLLAGVTGITWIDRLQRWRDEARDKTARWTRASIVGGSTLGDTLEGVERITGDFDANVVGLLGNELHRAYHLGGQQARRVVAGEYTVGEVWLCRMHPNGMLDSLVCPVCAALHMTVTELEPVTDTHPACRCMKVPYVAGGTPSTVSYNEFLRR